MNIAVEFFLFIFMIADFFVDKSTNQNYGGKDIEPEHKDDYRSKGTVNCGIIYGITYEP